MPTLRSLECGPPLTLSLTPGTGRGLLIHRAIELLGQKVAPEKARNALGSEITDDDWSELEKMTQGFMECLQAHFQPVSLHWEVPITAKNHQGSVVGGTVDLLVETPDGFWIVDHKSDEPQDIEELFNHYLPQLQCYSQALTEGMGIQVCGVAIHWACLGIMSST